MGRYIVRVAEEYYDDECDSRGYPIKKIRYTGEEYETTVNPNGAYVESGPDGWETHTVIGEEKAKVTFSRGHFGEELSGMFIYKNESNHSVLLECPYKCIEVAVIPNTVKRIEKLAFNGCFDLTTIVIPPSVEEISPEAFIGLYGYKESYHSVTLTFTKGTKTIPGNLLPSNTAKHTWSSGTYIVSDIHCCPLKKRNCSLK